MQTCKDMRQGIYYRRCLPTALAFFTHRLLLVNQRSKRLAVIQKIEEFPSDDSIVTTVSEMKGGTGGGQLTHKFRKN